MTQISTCSVSIPKKKQHPKLNQLGLYKQEFSLSAKN